MYDGSKIIILLIIFLVLTLFPVWHQMGKASGEAPELQLTAMAKEAGKCIESKDFMKTQHMKMLDRWRNEAVREGSRYYRSGNGKQYYKSLQVTCMECHTNKTKFCDQCHNYMGLNPYCWDCHIAPKENE